jgi:hypothetical protein
MNYFIPIPIVISSAYYHIHTISILYSFLNFHTITFTSNHSYDLNFVSLAAGRVYMYTSSSCHSVIAFSLCIVK